MTNFNVALEQHAAAEAKGDFAKMIALQSAIKFNGGGTPPLRQYRFWFLGGHGAYHRERIRRSRHRAREPFYFLEEFVPAEGASRS